MKIHPQVRLLSLTSISLCLGLAAAVVPYADASDWTGTAAVTTSWNSNGNPGWNGTGVPNAVGAVAQKNDGGTPTTAQDIGGGVTIGRLTLNGTGNTTWTITTPSLLTFNQDSGGAGTATISNTTALAGNNRLIVGAITIADDLLISNTSSSASSQGAISLGAISGVGNVTFNNVSNNVASGQIVFGQSGASFTGNVAFQRGAGTYLSGNGFGATANLVTIGSSGNSTTVINRNSATVTVGNNFVIAATTGTNTIGSDQSGATNLTHSGTFLLNGDLTVTSAKSGGNDVRFTNIISGNGGLSTAGTGEVQLGNGTASLVHTYKGNTTLTGSSSLVLADNAELTFTIGADGINNRISGSGQALTLDGNFNFDLTGAAAFGSWTIVDVTNLNEVFGSTFTVNGGFAESANIWTRVVGSSTFTFSETTGVLTAVPEPSSCVLVLCGTVAVGALRRRRC